MSTHGHSPTVLLRHAGQKHSPYGPPQTRRRGVAWFAWTGPGNGRRAVSRGGFSYIEIIMGVMILGFILVPLLSQFYIGFVGNRTADALSRATFLAVDLMEEIKSKRFDERLFPDEPTPVEQFGPDAGESAQDRRTFDDVDDFQGWTQSPPQSVTGAILLEFSEFTRSVRVEYVMLDAAGVWQMSLQTTEYKRITVAVQSADAGEIQLQTIVSYRPE